MSFKRLAAFLAVSLAAIAFAACGSDDSSNDGGSASTTGGSQKVVVDVGTQKIDVDGGAKPKIAFIPAGTTLQYSKAWIKGIQDAGAKLGVEVKLFDPAFDPTKQANIVQNIIQQGEYDAILIQPLSDQLCNPLTKDAPGAGIVVVVHDLPLCDRSKAPFGEEIWAPGTLAYVGAQSSATFLDASAKIALDGLTGSQNVAGVLGPPLAANSIISKAGLEAYVKERPEVKLAGIVSTDFTTAGALKSTTNFLQANPDLTAVTSPGSSDITLGVATAIKQAGRVGRVQIIQDLGAAKSVIPLIKSGVLKNSFAYYPSTDGAAGVQAVVDAFAGKPVERAIAALKEGTPEQPFEVNRDNVDSFVPEF